MCHCPQRNFFFFENAKIWVVRTTLNREKKGDGLTPEEVENESFTLKRHQMISVHTTAKKLKTQQSPLILEILGQENHVIIVTSLFSKSQFISADSYLLPRVHRLFRKLRFQNVSPSRTYEKTAFSSFSGLKSVFEKLRFRDGFVKYGR